MNMSHTISNNALDNTANGLLTWSDFLTVEQSSNGLGLEDYQLSFEDYGWYSPEFAEGGFEEFYPDMTGGEMNWFYPETVGEEANWFYPEFTGEGVEGFYPDFGGEFGEFYPDLTGGGFGGFPLFDYPVGGGLDEFYPVEYPVGGGLGEFPLIDYPVGGGIGGGIGGGTFMPPTGSFGIEPMTPQEFIDTRIHGDPTGTDSFIRNVIQS